MPHCAKDQVDIVPHLPELLISMGGCWRHLRDAQTEVRPFGVSHRALAEATAAIEMLAHHLTGQSGFFAMADDQPPYSRGGAVPPHDDEVF